MEIITSHKKEVELMTAMLIEFETLEAEDLKKIMDGEWDADEKRERLKKIDERHRKPKKKARKDQTPGDEGAQMQPSLTRSPE